MAKEEKRYCIAMMNVPKDDPEIVLPLIFVDDPQSSHKRSKPAVFNELEKAIEAAKGYKEWHPEIEFEVRPFDRAAKYVYEIMEYGRWIIGKETLFHI